MTDPMAPVFRALADPGRRVLLDRLFERDGQTLGELCEHLPEMTRFGVMKHLSVLEDANLLTTVKVGREKRHFLNPVPIRLVHDRWIGKFAERRVAALSDLKHELETKVSTTVATTTQVYQVFIRTTPEAIWDAITRPEFTAKYFHGARVEADSHRYLSRGPDGSLWLDGAVYEFDPPRRLVHEWQSRYDPELVAEGSSRVTYDIEPQAGGFCKLTLTHDRLENAPKTASSVGGAGWMFILSGLKTLLETGEPLATA
jgi:uncharacterized protein YndB with AHSA1/START domain/DNA-binding transcriptional ArsR family regulator